MRLLSIILLIFVFISCAEETSELLSQYTLSTQIIPTEGGSVSPEDGEFNGGTQISVEATPNQYYEFVKWGGDGNGSQSNPIGLTVSSNIRLIAEFDKNDDDEDGILDLEDLCSNTLAGDLVDSSGCSDSQKDTLSLTLNSEYANLSNANVVTCGIFAIWWDKNFDHNHLSESDVTCEYLKEVRERSLNQLNMFDPPNLDAGYYVNIYIHHDEDIFPSYWGNGVGTDSYGVPYWATGHGGAVEAPNVFHEGFHIFQYNQNSPGFRYTGDGMWYTEATAQWFAFTYTEQNDNSIVEAASLVMNPQITLWHSFQNRAPNDPVTWLYEVRQYSMHGYLYYLTDIEGVDPKYITSGFSENVQITPQQYHYEKIGGSNLRRYFGNWAAANTSDLSYLTRGQVARAYQEVNGLINAGVTSSDYINTYAIEIDANDLKSSYEPPSELRPRSWAYNVIKVINSANKTFEINFSGSEKGSQGANSYFENRIVTKSGDTYSTINFNLDNGLSGKKTISLSNDEDEFYIVVSSVPEQFSGNQNYNYSISLVE